MGRQDGCQVGDDGDGDSNDHIYSGNDDDDDDDGINYDDNRISYDDDNSSHDDVGNDNDIVITVVQHRCYLDRRSYRDISEVYKYS